VSKANEREAGLLKVLGFDQASRGDSPPQATRGLTAQPPGPQDAPDPLPAIAEGDSGSPPLRRWIRRGRKLAFGFEHSPAFSRIHPLRSGGGERGGKLL